MVAFDDQFDVWSVWSARSRSIYRLDVLPTAEALLSGSPIPPPCAPPLPAGYWLLYLPKQNIFHLAFKFWASIFAYSK
jgi:hypothetical protein